MSKILVGVSVADGDLVGLSLSSPNNGGPVILKKVLRVIDRNGQVELQKISGAADDEGMLLISPNKVNFIYTPRKDVARTWRGYWDRRKETFGSQPLPRSTLSRIVDPQVPVIVHELDFAPGNVSVAELVAIVQIAKRYQPSTCFEIGTFDGRTTMNLAANVAGHVYTLDLPFAQLAQARYKITPADRKFIDKAHSGGRFQDSPLQERIVQLYGDSDTFDYEPYRSAIDLVFVDGSHSYEYARNDLDKALLLLRRGPTGTPKGTILLHDYGAWEGVTRVAEELRRTDPRFAGLRHISGTTLAILRFD